MNKKYDIGDSLRMTVECGKRRRTDLGKLFEIKLLENTGIAVRYSSLTWFNKDYPTIFIYVDAESREKLFASAELDTDEESCYPKGKLLHDITECFNCAAVEMGLARIEFPERSVRAVPVCIHNYATLAASLYFSLNIEQIDASARSAFGDVEFVLKFRRSADNVCYYLIFEDEGAFAYAEKNGITRNIIDHVINICRKNDPLNIFDSILPLPEITTKTAIHKSGAAMGIARENPGWF